MRRVLVLCGAIAAASAAGLGNNTVQTVTGATYGEFLQQAAYLHRAAVPRTTCGDAAAAT